MEWYHFKFVSALMRKLVAFAEAVVVKWGRGVMGMNFSR